MELHMGAQPGPHGCRFRVWAPNAREVYVVGSFNSFSEDANPMESEGDGKWTTLIANAHPGDEYKYRIVNEFIAMLQRLYDPHNQAIVGPIFQQTVRNAMLAAMSMPDGTLIDVYRIISDNEYIKRVLPYITDPLVKGYYEDIVRKMSGASDHWKAELLPYLLSKFSRFVEDATLRRMIGQPRTSIPWHKVIDEQKILLVNLAKGRIGQDNASFIGGLVLSGMLQAAFKRGELPVNKRKDFFMYIDEV